MHVLYWLLTGLLAGLIARLVLRRSGLSLGEELALGGMGGLAFGTLIRYSGLWVPTTGGANFAIALTGAIGSIAAMHILMRFLATHARPVVEQSKVGLDMLARFSGLRAVERTVLTKFFRREPVSRDFEKAETENVSLGQRAADRIAGFGGSWAFMGLFAVFIAAWMLYNTEVRNPFDPYPFILLNLMLSCLAAAQAPVILMSQNRQSEKDRLHANADYAVNLKAELEILALHEKIDELRQRGWQDLIEMQQRQLSLLEQLERRVQ